MKKLILFIMFFIYLTNNTNAVLDDEDPHKISDDYISKLEYCNILNGLNPNQKTLPFSNIAILETSPYPNVKLEPEELQQKIIYGIDAIEDNKQVSHHPQTICIILNQIISTINFIFSLSTEEMKKYNCTIINMSLGTINNNKYLDECTQFFLKTAFTKGNETFLEIIKNYNEGTIHKDAKDCISKGLPDCWGFSKIFNQIEPVARNKKFSNADEFLYALSNALTEEFCLLQKKISAAYLQGDFLLVQALDNNTGILSSNNCSFGNVETKSPERENIIFVRNLYLYQETDYITPKSEIPTEHFANRTLCAVTPPINTTEISGNSFAAPVISACALMIESTLKQKELPTLLPSEIAQCLLKTAKRIFLASEDDRIEIDGEFFSKTYGAGIIQMDDAINCAIDMAKEKSIID